MSRVTVIRAVQRSRAPGGRCRDKIRADFGCSGSSNVICVEQRRLHVAEVARRAAASGAPPICGMLAELRRGLLGSALEQSRWAVLEPASAALSLWDKPPMDDETVLSCSGSKASRKTYALERLEELDSNPSFRNIFLRFEGGSGTLCLTAPDDGEFNRWMGVFRQFGAENALHVPCPGTA